MALVYVIIMIEILTSVYKLIFPFILKIATTGNYHLARENNCNPCEGNTLNNSTTRKKTA